MRSWFKPLEQVQLACSPGRSISGDVGTSLGPGNHLLLHTNQLQVIHEAALTASRLKIVDISTPDCEGFPSIQKVTTELRRKFHSDLSDQTDLK
ncbi:unnamed protein product [Ceratitis capitata]|uniref:(Mediterranean fruit fly) hypothetical protein n=1 Tax=Ceratitis capitata TaxID=7213 RepID=A0A811V4Z9_CERCA|nr:unnamed protein product [Ceratitis capitata]